MQGRRHQLSTIGAGEAVPLRATSPGSPVTSPPTALLSMRGINKSFGAVHVLHDVDFDVYRGQVTALVGDNGAGKSTLVKCLAGIYGIDAGQVIFDGQPGDHPRPA